MPKKLFLRGRNENRGLKICRFAQQLACENSRPSSLPARVQHVYLTQHTDWPQLSRTVHVLNRFYWTDWLKTSRIVSSRPTLHYITLPYITLHFRASVRFFSRIHIFSRLYNLPPRQAFWSSRRPDSLATIASMAAQSPPLIFNYFKTVLKIKKYLNAC